MSTRPLRHRVATVLLSLLYLLAWGEPVALHPCPMHDGAGVMAMQGGGHAMGAMGSAHDGMMAHAAMPAPVDHGAPAERHGAHTCQCLGHGCCAAAVVVPARQQVRWFAVVTRRVDPPAAPAPTLPRAPAPQLLPPATGPPTLG